MTKRPSVNPHGANEPKTEPWRTARHLLRREGAGAEQYIRKLVCACIAAGYIQGACVMSDVLEAVVVLRRGASPVSTRIRRPHGPPARPALH